jgi:hypothetical protein
MLENTTFWKLDLFSSSNEGRGTIYWVHQNQNIRGYRCGFACGSETLSLMFEGTID